MIEKKVKLTSIADIEKFNKICSSFSGDMDLAAGKYYIDAKSLLGIYSLNLDLPLTLYAGVDDEELLNEKLKDFLI